MIQELGSESCPQQTEKPEVDRTEYIEAKLPHRKIETCGRID